MKKFIVILAWAWSTFVCAQTREWTPEENRWLAASTAMLVADWAQTRTLIREINTPFNATRVTPYHETNPVLGRNPSMGTVNLYFMSMLGLNYLIADNLNQHRTHWLMFTTVIEFDQVHKNASIGIKFSF